MKNIDKKERVDAHRRFHRQEFPQDIHQEEQVVYCSAYRRMWEATKKMKERNETN